MSAFWKDQIEEIKKKWVVFLLFGIIIIVINTVIQTYMTYTITEQLKGPPM